MALWNLDCLWPRLGGGHHRFLDYQVPLKAKQADCGIGKIDLLGVTDRGRLIVVELKYPRSGRGDSPQHALMEGLRYAAIVEANLEPLASEAGKRFGVKVDDKMPPIVQVLGPGSWWRDWLDPGLKSRRQVTGIALSPDSPPRLRRESAQLSSAWRWMAIQNSPLA